MTNSKKTKLIFDKPAGKDDYGAHQRIVDALFAVINEKGPKNRPLSVALVGDRGTGKSTVIEILKEKLGKEKVCVFDSWAHEHEPLRRIFLKSLKSLVKDKNLEDEINRVGNRIQSKTVETKFNVGLLGAAGFCCAALISFISHFLHIGGKERLEFFWPLSLSDFLSRVYWPAFLMMFLACSFLILFVAKLIKVFGQGEERSLIAAFQQTVSSILKPETTESTQADLSYDLDSEKFENLFIKVVNQVNHKVVVVLDNLDRLDGEKLQQAWGAFRVLFDEHQAKEELKREVIFISALENDKRSSKKKSDRKIEVSSKNFDAVFHVPKFSYLNWRHYLTQQLKVAFCEITEEEIEKVKSFWTSVTPPTPREINDILNRAVISHRISGDLCPEVILHIYYQKEGFYEHDNFKSKISIINESVILEITDYTEKLASIHFNLDGKDALHELSGPDISLCIYQCREADFEKQIKTPGANEVFERVLKDGIKSWGSSLEQILYGFYFAKKYISSEQRIIQNLSGQAKHLFDNPNGTVKWDKLDVKSAEGLLFLLRQLKKNNKKIIDWLAINFSSIGKANAWREDHGQQIANEVEFSRYLEGLITIIFAIEDDADLSDLKQIDIPLKERLFVRLLWSIARERAIPEFIIKKDLEQSEVFRATFDMIQNEDDGFCAAVILDKAVQFDERMGNQLYNHLTQNNATAAKKGGMLLALCLLIERQPQNDRARSVVQNIKNNFSFIKNQIGWSAATVLFWICHMSLRGQQHPNYQIEIVNSQNDASVAIAVDWVVAGRFQNLNWLLNILFQEGRFLQWKTFLIKILKILESKSKATREKLIANWDDYLQALNSLQLDSNDREIAKIKELLEGITLNEGAKSAR